MNSLNIISARVSPPPSPAPSRTNSLSALGLAVRSGDDEHEHPSKDRYNESIAAGERNALSERQSGEYAAGIPPTDEHDCAIDEDTPLLSYGETKEISPRGTLWHILPRRIASTFINSLRWVLSTLAAPGVYLIACLYDENGRFAPLRQLRMLFGGPGASRTQKGSSDAYEEPAVEEKGAHGAGNGTSHGDPGGTRFFGSSSSSSGLSSESESDRDRKEEGGRSTASSRHRPLQVAPRLRGDRPGTAVHTHKAPRR